MIKTNEYEFDRKGRITILDGGVDVLQMLKDCVSHARRKKIKKPDKWRFVPTLTDSL